MKISFDPYSKSYFLPTVSLGNLPGFLIGTKPHPNSKATGHPKINPLDSGPTTTSTPKSFACAALIEEMGGEVVGMEFVIELEELKATEKLSKYNIYSQVKY